MEIFSAPGSVCAQGTKTFPFNLQYIGSVIKNSSNNARILIPAICVFLILIFANFKFIVRQGFLDILWTPAE